MDHRDYTDGAGKCGIEANPPDLITKFNANTANKFVISCPAVTTSTYTLRAKGATGGPMAGFTYEVNEQGAKTTAAVPTGWVKPSPNTCWGLRKEGSCS